VCIKELDRSPKILGPALHVVRHPRYEADEERVVEDFGEPSKESSQTCQADLDEVESRSVPAKQAEFLVVHSELVVGREGVVVVTEPHPEFRVEIAGALRADTACNVVTISGGAAAAAGRTSHAVSSR
jgi:hypothetical protein